MPAADRRGSAVSPFRRGLASGSAREQGKNFPEDLLAGNGLRKRPVRHDLVAVAAAIFVRADITGRCQVVHDAVGASLSDVQAGRDVMQSHPRVVREKRQHTAVVTHAAPATMPKTLSRFLEKNCEHCVVDLRIQGSSAARCPHSAGSGNECRDRDELAGRGSAHEGVEDFVVAKTDGCGLGRRRW
jgi:hypothetical protein